MMRLASLFETIDRRVAQIRAGRPDWPCGKGCDACCRHLAALPQLTFAEWELLRPALAALPAPRQAAIRRRIDALGPAPDAPVVCPLLDAATGACPVYAARPVACRTYGFYVERDKGLYCAQIEAQAGAGGPLADVLWGNQQGIMRELDALGAPRSLAEWIADADTDAGAR